MQELCLQKVMHLCKFPVSLHNPAIRVQYTLYICKAALSIQLVIMSCFSTPLLTNSMPSHLLQLRNLAVATTNLPMAFCIGDLNMKILIFIDALKMAEKKMTCIIILSLYIESSITNIAINCFCCLF